MVTYINMCIVKLTSFGKMMHLTRTHPSMEDDKHG